MGNDGIADEPDPRHADIITKEVQATEKKGTNISDREGGDT